MTVQTRLRFELDQQGGDELHRGARRVPPVIEAVRASAAAAVLTRAW